MRFAFFVFVTVCVTNITSADAPLVALQHAVTGFCTGMLAAPLLADRARKHGVKPRPGAEEGK